MKPQDERDLRAAFERAIWELRTDSDAHISLVDTRDPSKAEKTSAVVVVIGEVTPRFVRVVDAIMKKRSAAGR